MRSCRFSATVSRAGGPLGAKGDSLRCADASRAILWNFFAADQIPEENRDAGPRFIRAAGLAFLGRAEDAERANAHLITKDGEQVFEIWLNGGGAYARATEQDLDHEGFRKLDLRICATGDELNKFDNPKHFAWMRQDMMDRQASLQPMCEQDRDARARSDWSICEGRM
jgi:hypothetical protein